MRLRTTLWLLFWCVVLALCVWLTRRVDHTTGAVSAHSQQMVDLSARPVTGLTLSSAGGLIECRRQTASAEWRLVKPIDYRADQEEVDRILGTLEAAVVRERVSPEQRHARGLRFADYGLARPSLRVALDDGVTRRILMVGAESPLGDQIYVRVAGEPDVMAVSRDLLAVLHPSVSDLRDRGVLRGVASSAMRVELDRPQGGFIQLVRTGGRWLMQQPMSARSDSAKIDAMLEAAFALRVERYVWDPSDEATAPAPVPAASPVDAAVVPLRDRVEPYGLGAGEAVRLAIWNLEPDSRQDILLGKPTAENPEWIYAKRGDSPSILAVSRKALEVLALSVRDVRDRQVFPFAPEQVRQVQVIRDDRRLTLTKRPDSGWILTDPVQAKADDMIVQAAVADMLRWRVASFLDVPRTNLAERGLAPPAWSVQLWTRLPPAPGADDAHPGGAQRPDPVDDPANPSTLCLHVSATGPESNLLYAVAQGANELVALPSAVARHPAAQVENSLVFRDRTVLAVPTANIQKVLRTSGTREEAVFRDESGAWTRAGAPDWQVNRSAVEALLFGVANLRALRVESQAPVDLSPYGLDQPALVVTLRLTGEAGIQKTLTVGRSVEGEGAYAMVKGVDMVFVLGADAVRMLSTDLTAPPAVSPAGSTGGATSAPPLKVSP